MESWFGNSPWDFGTGFSSPFTTDPNSFQPVAPQTDLASSLASAFASQGIKPDQFMADPNTAANAAGIAPGATATGAGGSGANPWDPTPVDMPGGPATTLPAQPSTAPSANPQAADANAAATPTDKNAAQKPFGDRLAETLKGVKAPPSPTPQKVSSPSAPTSNPTGVKGGNLLQLLAMMAPQASQVAVPLSLSRSIR